MGMYFSCPFKFHSSFLKNLQSPYKTWVPSVFCSFVFNFSFPLSPPSISSCTQLPYRCRRSPGRQPPHGTATHLATKPSSITVVHAEGREEGHDGISVGGCASVAIPKLQIVSAPPGPTSMFSGLMLQCSVPIRAPPLRRAGAARLLPRQQPRCAGAAAGRGRRGLPRHAIGQEG